MSGEPLLTHGESFLSLDLRSRSSSKDGAVRWACGKWIAARRSAIRRWLSTTTSKEYLSSPASRRTLWKYYVCVVIPGFVLDMYTVFITGGQAAHSPSMWAFDLSELLTAALFACLPVDSLKSDFLMVTYFVLQYGMNLSLSPDSDVDSWAVWFLDIRTFLCFAAGFHSSCGLFFLVFASVCCFSDPRVDPMQLPQHVFFSGTMVVVLTLLEGELAFFFQELREQLGAVQQLLDKATSGYCTVSRRSGSITSASEGLCRLFAADLRGKQVLDFVHAGDRAGVSDFFGGDSTKAGLDSSPRSSPLSSASSSMLATFVQMPSHKRPAGAEFEARLVHYRSTSTDLHISFQKIGELRSATKGESQESVAKISFHSAVDDHEEEPEEDDIAENKRRAGQFRAWQQVMEGSVSDRGFVEPARERPPEASQPEPRRCEHRVQEQWGAHEKDAELAEEDVEEQWGAREKEAGLAEEDVEDRTTLPGSKSNEEPLDLWVSFDSGDPNFEIRDCCYELLPELGNLKQWFQSSLRSEMEDWILEAITHCDEDGNCPSYAKYVELTIPPRPATKIRARMACLKAEMEQMNEDGSVAVPAVLHMSGAHISYESNPGELRAISEDEVSPNDSASVLSSDARRRRR